MPAFGYQTYLGSDIVILALLDDRNVFAELNHFSTPMFQIIR